MLGMALVSGGIDSPVAAHLIARKADLLPVYFENSPFSAPAYANRAMKAIQRLRVLHKNILEPVVLSHGPSLQAYVDGCDKKYACIFCKRMMVRVASALGTQEGAEFLVMGDSLGQVASQTLQNLAVVEEASSLPIVRPLIAFDKVEIERVAKEIGTYEISSKDAGGCLAVPDKPSTRARLSKLLEEEAKLDIPSLVGQSLKSMRAQ